MTESIRGVLASLVRDVRSFGDAVSGFPQEFPEIFEDALLQAAMDDFTSAYATALHALENPQLNIATFGTTSSGKSTLLNALIGRRIAPMDSAEMSGGVLEISDGDERLLRVGSFSENPPWDTGDWRNVSDEAAYTRIRDKVMGQYQAARRQADKPVTFPQVAYTGPILPVRDSSLLGTPDGFQLRFVDLPGLNHVNDRDNLRVVQDYVKGAFCLVVLDYGHTDEMSRQMLLEELRKTIKAFGGQPESMIFILNRVDQRGGDDEPLDTRLNILRREIQAILKLREEPDIIPFEARLLYNAQVAWGAAGGNIPQAPADLRREHVGRLFEESASTLSRQSSEDDELDDWLHVLKRQIRQGKDLSPDEMQRLLTYARDWSGGTILWNTLRERLTQSLDRLLVVPALTDLIATYEHLQKQLGLVSAQKKSDIETITQEIDGLKNAQRKLNQAIEKRRHQTDQDLSAIVQHLRNNDEAAAIKTLKGMGAAGEKLNSLRDVIDEIHANLLQNVIAHLRSGLEGDKSIRDLESALNKVLSPYRAALTTNAVDKYRTHLAKLSANKKSKKNEYLIELPKDDSNIEKLEELERLLLSLNENTRVALNERTEVELQIRTTDIFDAVRELLKLQAQEMEQLLAEEVADTRLREAIQSTYRGLVRNDFKGAQSNLFESTVQVKKEDKTRREKVGENKRVVKQKGNATAGGMFGLAVGGLLTVLTGGAGLLLMPGLATAGAAVGSQIKSGEQTITEDVHGDVTYVVLTIPTERALSDGWAQSVKEGLDTVWEPLLDWLSEMLKDAQHSFSSAMSDVIATMDHILEDKAKSKEEERMRVHTMWQRFDRHTERSVMLFTTLAQSYELDAPERV